jgi:O-antigen/teichoic acid export membrane protein
MTLVSARGVPPIVIDMLSVLGSEGVSRLAQIGIIALASRQLNASGFGIYGIAWSIQLAALSFVQTGPELVGIRFGAQDFDLRSVAQRVTAWKFLMAALSMIVSAFFAIALYGASSPILVQTAVQSLVLIPLALNGAWILKACERFSEFALARSLQAVIFLILVWLLLNVWLSPLALPFAELGASSLITAAWWPRLIKRCIAPSAEAVQGGASPPPYRELIKASIALALAGFFSAIFWAAPVTIAGRFLSAVDAGAVAAACRVIATIQGICIAAVQVFYPILTRTFEATRKAGAELAGALTLILSFGALLITAFLSLTAGWTMPLLLGDVGIPVIQLFQIWIFILVPALAGTVPAFALMAGGRNFAFTRTMMMSAFGAVVISWIGYRIFPIPLGGTFFIIPMAMSAAILFWHAGQFRLLAWPSSLSLALRTVLPSPLPEKH